MSTTITVCDGARTIGGNKILLESDGAALFLDFGLCYPKWGLYYEEFVRPRVVRGLFDPLVMGLLPPIRGIYREDLMPARHLVERMLPDGSPEVQAAAVLLSHAHGDHMGYISFLRPDIPIVCSPMTAMMAKAMQDSGKSGMDCEFCYASRRELDAETGIVKAGRDSAVQRPFRLSGDEGLSDDALAFWTRRFTATRALESILPESRQYVAGMPVRTFPVDHSIYGACAFAVQTPGGWVVYTGDLRTHGRNGQLTQTFAEEAAKLQPIALICEGTHVKTQTPVHEETVRANCLRAVLEAEGKVVIADFGPRNVERLESFLGIAEEVGRKLVVTGKDALLLHAMHLADPCVPDPSEHSLILLYDEPRGKTDGWTKFVLDEMDGKLVSPDQIRESAERFILCFSYLDLSDLAELAPENGGVYIYSSSELYGEEQEIDFRRLRNWLDRFAFTLVGDPNHKEGEWRYHASGHITGPDLERLVRTINPKVLIPVHTEPEKSHGWFRERFEDLDLRLPREMEAMNV